jgi:hypothetical protein
MTPRVSVLLPTHNRADVLRLSIASILAQSFTDFELLVVADGCTDGTAGLVRAIDDPRVRFFDWPKAPSFGYANRNRAVAEARGELVALATHDDLLMPDHLERLSAAFATPTVVWAYSRPLWVSTDGFVVPFGVNLTIEDERREFLTTRNTIPMTCVMCRRDAFVDAGGFPEDAPGGGDWRLHVAMLGRRGAEAIAYEPEPTSLHFSANWKRARDGGFNEVAELIAIAESSAWWPAALRAHVPEGEPEQAAVWREICRDPIAWTAASRAAVRAVCDRIAWDTIRTRLQADRARDRRIAQLEAEALAAGAHAADAERCLRAIVNERDTTQRALDELRTSRSWRITAPLRALRRRLGRS